MAPQKQNASYELIETGGDYGAVEPASTDAADEEYDKYDGGEAPRRKLLSLVAPASATGKFLFVLCIVLVVASRLCTLAAPLALSQAIDGLEVASPTVVTLILVYVALRFASDLLSNAKTAFWSRVTGEISTTVATEVFAHIHRQSLGWHLGRKTGATVLQVQRGVNGVATVLNVCVFTLAPTLLQLALVSGIFFKLKVPAVTLCLVSSAAMYVVFTFSVAAKRVPVRRAQNAAANDVSNCVVESLANFETVKYFAASELEVARYRSLRWTQRNHDVHAMETLALLNAGQSFLIQLGLGASLLFAARAVLAGEMSAGEFVACQLYVLELFRPLSSLGFSYSQLVGAVTDCADLVALLGTAPSVADAPGAPDLAIPGTGAVEVVFDDVSFRYGPNLAGVFDLSFVVAAGKTVAFVGPSGSGKSTTARLACRLYDVAGGSVRVGGIDIRGVKQASLRRLTAVVAQETVLFNESVAFNIGYGLDGDDRERVVQAAKRAQLHDRVISWEDGYDTVVGERGLRLSGGEKQRLGIARALVRDPRILILDEATSALDTTTERAIQQSLTEASKGRTTLVVAHRLSTIIGADEIIVLRDGRAVERGTHAVLAKKPKGLYAGLWKAQSGTEKKGYLSAEECRRHIDTACPSGCPALRNRPLLRTVSLPAPRPAVQDDNDLIYRPAPVAVEQVVELHDEEE